MNTMGIVFLATVARVTVLGFIGVTLAFVLKRRGPSAVALATITTLSALVAVTAMSLSPWPRFWSFEMADAPARIERSAKPAHHVEPLPHPEKATQASPVVTGVTFSELSRIFMTELRSQQNPEPAESHSPWRWPAWVAAGLIAAAGIGLARLTLALRAVALLRRRSVPLMDVALRDEVDLLIAEIGRVQGVELRESSDLTTPATVGWRRPVLLVPTDWGSWQPDERRAALAHELAHVQGGDYLTGLWAQACLSFHLYHPLVHWLVARLRLEQELAADAAAARFSGGSRAYLEALARLALRRPGPLEPSPVAGLWPAQSFLPTRGMFLRRMEMLRNPNSAPQTSEPLHPLGRALTVAMVGTAALFVAGLRGPLQAQQEAKHGEAAVTKPRNGTEGEASAIFDLSHVPADTVVAIAGRPSALLAKPEFKPIVDLFKPDSKSGVGTFNLPIQEIESFQVLFRKGRAPGQPFGTPPIFVVHATKPQDWKVVAEKFIGDPETVPFEGLSYVRTKRSPVGAIFLPMDDKTGIIGNETDVKAWIQARKGEPIVHTWDQAWAKAAKGHLAVAIDPGPFTALFPEQPVPGSPQAAFAAKFGMFSPLFEKSSGYAVGINAEKGMALDLIATTPDEASAKSVEETLSALITLGKNALEGLRRQLAAAPNQRPAEAQLVSLILEFGEPMLTDAKASRPENNVVEVRAATEKNIAAAINPLMATILAARATARHAQSMNSMKQVGLAFHNFHDAYGHFPPAVLRDKPGKVPYSWRVAILPFIEQNELYNAYNFSEPWDSPSNKKLLERIPAIYRHPNDAPNSVNTAYFVPTGAATLFPPDDTGTTIANILDGSSNTVMTIEAKRAIPWTKPEDVAVEIDLNNPDWKAPELGGYVPDRFLAGMADGSVRTLPITVNKSTLRAMFTRVGGEVIDWNVIENLLQPLNATRPAAGAPQPGLTPVPAKR